MLGRAPPDDDAYYQRPVDKRDRRKQQDVDRHLDNIFHPWFMFGVEARRKRHSDTVKECERLLHDLESSTNPHFIFIHGRPESRSKDPFKMTSSFVSRSIEMDTGYKAVARRLQKMFATEIAALRQREHQAMLARAKREQEESDEERRRRHTKFMEAQEQHRREHAAHEEARAQALKKAEQSARAARAAVPRPAPVAREPPATPQRSSGNGAGYHMAVENGRELMIVDFTPTPPPVSHDPPPRTAGNKGKRRADTESYFGDEEEHDDDDSSPTPSKNKGKGRALDPPELLVPQHRATSSIVEDSEPERQERRERAAVEEVLRRSLETAAEEEAKRAYERSGASSSRHGVDNTTPPPPTEPEIGRAHV